MHMAVSNLASSDNNNINPTEEYKQRQRQQQRDEQDSRNYDVEPEQYEPPSSYRARFPLSMSQYLNGMARITKQSFMDAFDLGVPWDPPKDGQEDVLLLYNRQRSLPSNKDRAAIEGEGPIPLLSNVSDAMINCDFLNIVLNDNGGRKQCVAIVPQYESFHIQKWMRVGPKGAMDSTKELRMVSRGYQANGREQFRPPETKHTRKLWTMLGPYLQHIDEVMDKLRPLADGCAKSGRKDQPPTVIVMVCNMGQSMLLMNFACAAMARGLDLKQVLVFATDSETKELAEALGLTAFYDEINFAAIPSQAAKRYGDRQFVAMMLAKVICVQLISMMGYNLLFQDVDMVWYKHPLKFFENPEAGDFDVYFQDDGAHTQRYAPYSANSGFYYVRHNARSQFFLTALLHAGDVIIRTDSHQQALIALLAEHASLYGLKVKVLSRDMDEFPGGYHFHQKSGKYMHAFFNGNIQPYLFHMSWTLNKDNKILFLKQMGDWWVADFCVGETKNRITSEPTVNTLCCLAEPAISCHFRDKPSKIPCNDSPSIDKNKPSWWTKFDSDNHGTLDKLIASISHGEPN